MTKKIAVTALVLSFFMFLYIISYPTNGIRVPYIQDATITCGESITTTHFSPPTSISSNAIIAPGYTYYYSNIIIIDGTTCTVSGKIEYTTLKNQ